MAQFNCIFCPKSFARKWLLERHEATMHNVQNYICDRCPKAFSRKDNLQRHQKVMHENTKHQENASNNSPIPVSNNISQSGDYKYSQTYPLQVVNPPIREIVQDPPTS